MSILASRPDGTTMRDPVGRYGGQLIGEDDIDAVGEALRSDWLTQGPLVARFEAAMAEYLGARYAVAVSSATAGLHLASLAAGFGPGDEVVTSPISFVASANCVAYTGAKPVFADIDPDTLGIDPAQVRARTTAATKGVIAIHFAGHPCDMPAISAFAHERKLAVIEDAAHAVGTRYTVDGRTHRVGDCAHSDMAVFSFHPVKQMTTGEGGLVTTNRADLYERLTQLRTHGITRAPERMERNDGPWYYEQHALGFNYRLTDLQCALGLSQLRKLDAFIARRREIVAAYNRAFAANDELITPTQRDGTEVSWHLYVLGFRGIDRRRAYDALRARGLGVNVHYIPIHLQPYYRERYGYAAGDFPQAERYYDRSLTIPLHPGLSDADVAQVIGSVNGVVAELRA